MSRERFTRRMKDVEEGLKDTNLGASDLTRIEKLFEEFSLKDSIEYQFVDRMVNYPYEGFRFNELKYGRRTYHKHIEHPDTNLDSYEDVFTNAVRGEIIIEEGADETSYLVSVPWFNIEGRDIFEFEYFKFKRDNVEMEPFIKFNAFIHKNCGLEIVDIYKDENGDMQTETIFKPEKNDEEYQEINTSDIEKENITSTQELHLGNIEERDYALYFDEHADIGEDNGGKLLVYKANDYDDTEFDPSDPGFVIVVRTDRIVNFEGLDCIVLDYYLESGEEDHMISNVLWYDTYVWDGDEDYEIHYDISIEEDSDNHRRIKIMTKYPITQDDSMSNDELRFYVEIAGGEYEYDFDYAEGFAVYYHLNQFKSFNDNGKEIVIDLEEYVNKLDFVFDLWTNKPKVDDEITADSPTNDGRIMPNSSLEKIEVSRDGENYRPIEYSVEFDPTDNQIYRYFTGDSYSDRLITEKEQFRYIKVTFDEISPGTGFSYISIYAEDVALLSQDEDIILQLKNNAYRQRVRIDVTYSQDHEEGLNPHIKNFIVKYMTDYKDISKYHYEFELAVDEEDRIYDQGDIMYTSLFKCKKSAKLKGLEQYLSLPTTDGYSNLHKVVIFDCGNEIPTTDDLLYCTYASDYIDEWKGSGYYGQEELDEIIELEEGNYYIMGIIVRDHGSGEDKQYVYAQPPEITDAGEFIELIPSQCEFTNWDVEQNTWYYMDKVDTSSDRGFRMKLYLGHL